MEPRLSRENELPGRAGTEGGAAEPTDEELARAAKAGADEAFDKLILRYQRAVYALARRLAGGHEEADDIAQESFLQTWRSLSRYDPRRPFRPWLFRIAANTALNALRRARSRREVGLERVDGLPAPALSRGSDPPGEFLRSSLLEAVDRAMARLKPEERLVLHLRIEEEMPYRQMAETLGIRLGTVMSRLHRARKSLRQWLADEGVGLGGEEPDATL